MSGIYSAAQIAVAEESWFFWKSKGASDKLAAALLGNEDRETAFHPQARGDKDAHGVPQAGGPGQDHQARRAAIIKGCGIDVWTDPHPKQLEGIYQEMSASWSALRHVWPALMATASTVAANTILIDDFEMPKDRVGAKTKNNANASYWLQYAVENWQPGPQVVVPASPLSIMSAEQAKQAQAIASGLGPNAGEGRLPPGGFGLPKLLWKPTPNFYRSPVKRHLIVVHDCQGGYQGSIATFESQHHPRVSAHLVLKEDGSEATQMVPWTQDAWHVTDFNAGSIGLEMAGFAEKGFSDAEWSAEARMVAYLCHHFDIPITWAKTGAPGQRTGICRHYDLGTAGGGHTDPCTTDAPWLRFMGLVEAAAKNSGWPATWGHD